MSKTGPGTLKCIIVPGDCNHVLASLRRLLSDDNIRRIGAGTILVHTEIEASELRDRLSVDPGPGGSLLVIEFEKWSGYGEEVDREWLLARGH